VAQTESMNWQEVKSGDGRVYYFNASTGETSWTEAPEHQALVEELDAIVHLVDDMEGDMSELNVETATSLVGAITSHAHDRGVMQRVVHVVKAQASDTEQARFIADQARVCDLVPAMQLHADNVEMLSDAMSILDNLAQFQKFREALSSLEYITVINNTVLNNLSVGALAGKGMVTLGHLSYNNPVNIGHCMSVNVPRTATLVLRAQMADRAVVEAVVYCVANLLFESTRNKRRVTIDCAEELLEAGRTYVSDSSLFSKTMRLFGNLSIVDECILELAKRGAVALVVRGMAEHRHEREVIRTAMEVLSNFGAIEDEDMDSEVTGYIVSEGGIAALSEAMKRHDDKVDVLQAGMEALYNLGNDQEAAEVLVAIGVVEMTLSIIRRYDYESELVRQSMKFLSVITYSHVAVARLADIGGVPAMLQAIESRIDDEEFLVDAMLTMSNMFYDDRNRTELSQQPNGLATIVQLLELFFINKQLIRFTVTALKRLSAHDETSVAIAESGMHIFMFLVGEHVDDTEVLSMMFDLFSHLTFVVDNLKIIVQHGGVKVILETMTVLQDDAELIAKALHTLDNLVSADMEFATIIIEKGGRAAVEAARDAHPFDEGVKQAAESALLSMNAMARVKNRDGTKTNRGALFARLGGLVDMSATTAGASLQAAAGQDPLEQHRPLLRGGQVLAEFNSGTGVQRMLKASEDWIALTVRDVGTRKGAKVGSQVPVKRVELRGLRKVLRGCGEGHVKKGIRGRRANAAEDKSFYITALRPENELHFEAASTTDRDRWVAAIEQMLFVHTNMPDRLAP